jgi:adenylylsulfate kinase-like enzyme
LKNKIKIKPGLLWITGLSGSGKSTISIKLKEVLQKKYSNIVLLDGDILRKKLNIKNNNSFTYKKREKIGLKYVKYCAALIKKKKFVIIAAMALITKVQNKYRKINNTKDVFLDVPLNELVKRDPKKLYEKYFEKKVRNMVGLDLKYDIPKSPSLFIKWNRSLNKIKIVKKILKLLNEKN